MSIGKRKLMEENEKKDRKLGIIVVIIIVLMIVLMACCCCGSAVGILAPQYLKYVEKSHIASDRQAVSEVFMMAEVVAADPYYTSITGDGFIVSVDQWGTISVKDLSGNSNPNLEKELFALLGHDHVTLQSTQYQTVSSSCTFHNNGDGNWTKTEAGAVTY